MAVDWTNWPSDPYFSQTGFWDIRPPWIRPAQPATMRWAMRRTVEPTTEPVTLDRAKLHLRIDTTDDDLYVQDLISTAREYVELRAGLALMPQTWQLTLDRWPRTDRMEFWPWVALPVGSILLPRFPVTAVTSITWYGSDGSNNTLSNATYTLDTGRRIPRVSLNSTSSWPSANLIPQGGVQVLFTAGYATAALVPFNYRQAMMLLIGHWYANREEVVVGPRAVSIDVVHQATELISMGQPPMVG